MRKKYYKKENRTEFFDETVKKYGDRCMICGEYVRHLVIDHDHETGYMRGLLCHKHNSALGHFNDNIQHLKNAVEYLERAQVKEEEALQNRHIVIQEIREKLTKKDLHEIMLDPSYKNDRQRALALASTKNISYSAAQSRICREGKKMEQEMMQNANKSL